jgi:hypothetical protein
MEKPKSQVAAENVIKRNNLPTSEKRSYTRTANPNTRTATDVINGGIA